MKNLFSILTICLLLNTYIYSQNQDEALKLFNEQKYDIALPLFAKQVSAFPKEASYQYYTAVCMVLSKPISPKALEYLTYASEKAVPREVYYYMGLWYQKAYQFDNASNMYQKYIEIGNKRSKEYAQCKQQMEMVANAKKLVEKKTNFEVLKTDTIARTELFRHYNKLLKNGRFEERTEKPSFFGDQLTSWSFLPSLTDNEHPVVATSLKRNGNTDLVLLRKNLDGKWSKPESISPLINTENVEDYAYFNANEPALYFASKGHHSMGDYDIYKSVYYPDSKTWITPVNIGFPINSTSDDFLFVPSEDESCAYFASNRGVSSDKVVIYTISYSKNYAIANNSTNNDNLTTSLLRPVRTSVSKPKAKTKTVSPAVYKPPVATTDTIKTYPKALQNSDEYNRLINEALELQLHGDSLARVAANLRTKLNNTQNENEKVKLKKDITWNEYRAKNTQQKADSVYQKVREAEVALVSKNKPISTSKEIKNTDSSKNTIPVKDTKPSLPIEKLETKKVLYEFKVMAQSPYKTLNDIPLDIDLPDGIVYRVQLGAFSKPIEPNRFMGIVPVSRELVNNGNVTKYYVGMFGHNIDAEKALNKIREYGFKDAYIVSYFNKQSIPLSRAKDIEKNLE